MYITTEYFMKVTCLYFCLFLSLSAYANPPRIVDYSNQINFGFFQKKSRSIDIIVVHSTRCLDGDPYNVLNAIDVFRHYNVASHYMIDRNGIVYRLVAEKDIAYQAGKSVLPQNGRRMLNGSSIGIELLNSPTDPPTDSQYQALADLTKDIKTRYPIKYIVGHSDIAPKRKTDPWLFDWQKFNRLIQ